jgi:hypothetical protein
MSIQELKRQLQAVLISIEKNEKRVMDDEAIFSEAFMDLKNILFNLKINDSTLEEVINSNWHEKPTYKAQSADDFGNSRSIGLCVKRRKDFHDLSDHDFGIYLGEYCGKFHIGTMPVSTFHPSQLESFDSLDLLKRQWMLD